MGKCERHQKRGVGGVLEVLCVFLFSIYKRLSLLREENGWYIRYEEV